MKNIYEFNSFFRIHSEGETPAELFTQIMKGRYIVLEKEFTSFLNKIKEERHLSDEAMDNFTYVRKNGQIIMIIPYVSRRKEINDIRELCLEIKDSDPYSEEFETLYEEIVKIKTDAQRIFQYLVSILTSTRPKDRLPQILQDILPANLKKTSDRPVRKSKIEKEIEELIQEYLAYRIFQ